MNPKNVSIDIRRCRCHAYQEVLKSMGFNLTPDNPNANIVWWDGSIPVEEFNSIKPEQHVNKIPGMDYLCYKSVLFNSLNQMQSLYPIYYNFFPKTYLLPQQFQEFQKEHQKSIARNESNFLRSRPRQSNYLSFRINRTKTPNVENINKTLKNDTKVKESDKDQSSTSISASTSTLAPAPPSDLPSINFDEPEPATWIVKPRSGCCGSGIRLIQNSFDLAHDSTPSIVQKYIHPFLIDGHKFDFRFYLLITDLHPLSLFIYNEGIARFCTEKYEPPTRKNLNDKFIHITNTAINVENKNIKTNEFEYTRLASDVLKSIEQINSEKGGDVLWTKIKRVSILTILALYPEIMSSIKKVCGEIIIDDTNSDFDSNNNLNRKKASITNVNSNFNEKPLTAISRKQSRKSNTNPILIKTTSIKPSELPSQIIKSSLNQQLSQPIASINSDSTEISNENESRETPNEAQNSHEQEKNINESSKKTINLSMNEGHTKNVETDIIKSLQNQQNDHDANIPSSNDNDEQTSEKGFVVTRNPIHRFFHLLGIDIMIDEKCNPIVLELNDNPSMKITFPIEKKLKPQLLTDEMSIVTLDGSPAPQKAIEKGGWNILIPPSAPNTVIPNDDKDRHLNSLIRSIQQRSMNIFGPSTMTKRNLRQPPRTASSKSRYNSQSNSSTQNNQSSLSQNSISIEPLSKNEDKTTTIPNNSNLLEPLPQPKKTKQNATTPMNITNSKVTKPIIHPKLKYSVSAENPSKFRKTGYTRYYYQ